MGDRGRGAVDVARIYLIAACTAHNLHTSVKDLMDMPLPEFIAFTEAAERLTAPTKGG